VDAEVEIADNEEKVEEVEEVEPEQHDVAEEPGNEDENGFVDPYNHESFSRGLEVNLRNRASSFKKVILEDIKMIKKANIALFKKVNITEKDQSVAKWLEFDKNDLEQNVKIYKA
jgi:hypothetical protein